MSVITDPKLIKLFRMKVLLGALNLEIRGMRRVGKSTFSIIKTEFNLKGNKAKVYEQFKKVIEMEEKQLELPLEPV
jgi:hypothetical protein